MPHEQETRLMSTRDRSPQGLLRRCPRIVAHVIAESLGYATPNVAARIVAHAAAGQPDYCEWISACYRDNPRDAVENAIRRRHHHHGPMAEYRHALALVLHYAATGEGPIFASWF